MTSLRASLEHCGHCRSIKLWSDCFWRALDCIKLNYHAGISVKPEYFLSGANNASDHPAYHARFGALQTEFRCQSPLLLLPLREPLPHFVKQQGPFVRRATCNTGFFLVQFKASVRRFRLFGLFDAAHRWLPPACIEMHRSDPNRPCAFRGRTMTGAARAVLWLAAFARPRIGATRMGISASPRRGGGL